MPDRDAFRFGPFELLPGRRELLLRGSSVQLGARAFDLLLALVRRQGQLATKDELMAEVWPNIVVEENNLQVQISALRKVLGRDADSSRFLQSIPGRGYRFAAPIEHDSPPSVVFNPLAAPSDSTAEPLALPDKPSISVLPFTNMSGDPEQEYFADGIAEDIITALARFPSLFVIARNSSFTYKGRTVDVKLVGRELGVRYVLEGSVRKAGNRVRVAGQLVQADNGMHVWARRVCAIERDYEEATSLAERAVALNPNSAVAWRQGGYALVYCGRPEAALEYCSERCG